MWSALGNDRTLVTCKPCEAQKRFSKIYTPLVFFFFHFQIQTKKCTLILIFMLKGQIHVTPKSRKKNSMSIFGHVTGVVYWKIFATVFLCFIAGECYWSVNIIKYMQLFDHTSYKGTMSIMLQVEAYLYRKGPDVALGMYIRRGLQRMHWRLWPQYIHIVG